MTFGVFDNCREIAYLKVSSQNVLTLNKSIVSTEPPLCHEDTILVNVE